MMLNILKGNLRQVMFPVLPLVLLFTGCCMMFWPAMVMIDRRNNYFNCTGVNPTITVYDAPCPDDPTRDRICYFGTVHKDIECDVTPVVPIPELVLNCTGGYTTTPSDVQFLCANEWDNYKLVLFAPCAEDAAQNFPSHYFYRGLKRECKHRVPGERMVSEFVTEHVLIPTLVFGFVILTFSIAILCSPDEFFGKKMAGSRPLGVLCAKKET